MQYIKMDQLKVTTNAWMQQFFLFSFILGRKKLAEIPFVWRPSCFMNWEENVWTFLSIWEILATIWQPQV